jgi:hypothetical protein
MWFNYVKISFRLWRCFPLSYFVSFFCIASTILAKKKAIHRLLAHHLLLGDRSFSLHLDRNVTLLLLLRTQKFLVVLRLYISISLAFSVFIICILYLRFDYLLYKLVIYLTVILSLILIFLIRTVILSLYQKFRIRFTFSFTKCH